MAFRVWLLSPGITFSGFTPGAACVGASSLARLEAVASYGHVTFRHPRSHRRPLGAAPLSGSFAAEHSWTVFVRTPIFGAFGSGPGSGAAGS